MIITIIIIIIIVIIIINNNNNNSCQDSHREVCSAMTLHQRHPRPVLAGQMQDILRLETT